MAPSSPEPTYTVYIRLPFPRGDFVDPPPVNWDSSKDEALWSIISKLSKTEIDWNEIAAQFQVTVDFLLQQVAWLTERHASQVRAQMRKAAAAAKISPAPSPQPPSSDGTFLDNQRRPGSGPSGHSRAPSSTLVRRDSPLPRTETNTLSTSMRSTPRPLPTRTPSINNQSFAARNLGGGTKASGKAPAEPPRRRLTPLPMTTGLEDQDDREDRDYDDDYRRAAPRSPGPVEYSSAASSSSADSSSPAQSRIIRRPPRFQGNDGRSYGNKNDEDEDDDEDVEPAFLPYAKHAGGHSTTAQQYDLSATLRVNMRDSGKRLSKGPAQEPIHHSQTSDSSTSSTPVLSRGGADTRPNGPLSPRRNPELANQSPGGKSKAYSRDSNGTPSISSSFSDLDDASVTRSALEEALASEMRDGGTIASLRGTITNAFRSRYQ